MTTVNPTTVTVDDAVLASQEVTQVQFLVGTATGGPYSTSKATVPVSSLTAGTGGAYTVPFASLSFSPALQAFTTYFMVVEADNAQGASGNSPEVSFSLAGTPSAPTGLALS